MFSYRNRALKDGQRIRRAGAASWKVDARNSGTNRTIPNAAQSRAQRVGITRDGAIAENIEGGNLTVRAIAGTLPCKLGFAILFFWLGFVGRLVTVRASAGGGFAGGFTGAVLCRGGGFGRGGGRAGTRLTVLIFRCASRGRFRTTVSCGLGLDNVCTLVSGCFGHVV